MRWSLLRRMSPVMARSDINLVGRQLPYFAKFRGNEYEN
jgi:hypothetical protein